MIKSHCCQSRRTASIKNDSLIIPAIVAKIKTGTIYEERHAEPLLPHRVRLPGIPAINSKGHWLRQGPQGIRLRGAVHTGKALPAGREGVAGLIRQLAD